MYVEILCLTDALFLTPPSYVEIEGANVVGTLDGRGFFPIKHPLYDDMEAFVKWRLAPEVDSQDEAYVFGLLTPVAALFLSIYILWSEFADELWFFMQARPAALLLAVIVLVVMCRRVYQTTRKLQRGRRSFYVELDLHSGEEGTEEGNEEKEQQMRRKTINKLATCHLLPETSKDFKNEPSNAWSDDEYGDPLGSRPPHDSNCDDPYSGARQEKWGYWMEAEASLVPVKDAKFKETQQYTQQKGYLFQLAHTEIFAVDYKLYHVASRSDSYVQKVCMTKSLLSEQDGADGGKNGESKDAGTGWPTFVVNFQLPGKNDDNCLNLVAYFEPPSNFQQIKDVDRRVVEAFDRLFRRFESGSEEFRQKKFRVIPRVPYGHWFVQKTIHKAHFGPRLQKKFFTDSKRSYIEIDIDVDSSKMARRMLKLTRRHAKKMVLDLSFMFEDAASEDLPQCLLGGVRLLRTDMSKASFLNSDLSLVHLCNHSDTEDNEDSHKEETMASPKLPAPSQFITQPWGNWREANPLLLRMGPYGSSPPFLFRLAHVDMFVAEHKCYHVAARSDSYAHMHYIPLKRKVRSVSASPAFSVPLLVVNLIYPGESSEQFNNLTVYMLRTSSKAETAREAAIFDRVFDQFCDGSDHFRNRLFKMYSRVPEGNWLVKKAVKKAILHRKLKKKYFIDVKRNYIEVDVDVTSSKLASRILNMVKGHVKNLSIDISFGFDGTMEDCELDEKLLGGVRLENIDLSKVQKKSIQPQPELLTQKLGSEEKKQTSQNKVVPDETKTETEEEQTVKPAESQTKGGGDSVDDEQVHKNMMMLPLVLGE